MVYTHIFDWLGGHAATPGTALPAEEVQRQVAQPVLHNIRHAKTSRSTEWQIEGWLRLPGTEALLSTSSSYPNLGHDET